MGKPARARRDKERRVAGRHGADREELVRRTLGRRALREERWDGELTVQLLPQHLASGVLPSVAVGGSSRSRRRSTRRVTCRRSRAARRGRSTSSAASTAGAR